MELPQLAPAQIDEALKGTKYEGGDIGSVNFHNDAGRALLDDTELNAARAILLVRENERLQEALERIANRTCGEPSPDIEDWLDEAESEARRALAQTKGKTE